MNAEQHRLAAILFADIAGYSRVPEGVGLEYRRKMLSLAREILSEHHGRLVKNQGDDILVEFSSATHAVMFAMALQDKVSHQNAAAESGQRFRLRIGIHAGEVVVEGEDILGDAVNTAKRTESLAAPGGICMTESVWQQVHEQLPHTSRRLGRIRTKHMKLPLVSYHFDPPGAGWVYRLGHRFRLGLGHPLRLAGLFVLAGLILSAALLLPALAERLLPANSSRLLDRAKIHLDRYDREGYVERAINELVRVPRTAPQFAEARGYLGLAYWRLYLETGELKTRTDAFNESSNSLAVNADISIAHVVQGLVAEDKGNLIAASNELFLATALEREENGVTLIRFAKICQELLNEARAADCIRKARDVQKKDWEFYSELAKFEFNRGQDEAALTNGLEAIRLSPHNSFVQCNVANLYLALENDSNHLESAWAFLQASRKSRTTAFYYYSLGNYYHLAGDLEREADSSRAAAQLKPEDYRFWGRAGLASRNVGKKMEAGEFLNKALAKAQFVLLDSDNCLVRANMGLYHAALGHAEPALKALTQALQDCPENTQVLAAAAASRPYLGKSKEAEELARLLDKP